MLISFSISNWMSFREKVTLSLVGSREQQHADRVPYFEKHNLKILPVAVIYGGNASGKTNLFKALSFVKRLIVDGTHPDASIPVDPFLLDKEFLSKASSFTVELFVNGKIYEFSFQLTRIRILEEKLIEITDSKEKVLYHRKRNSIEFDSSLQKDQFLQFAFQGTRENQLFLTNSISQKVHKFSDVYDWFSKQLSLISPAQRFGRIEKLMENDKQFFPKIESYLSQLDTGIIGLKLETVKDSDLRFPRVIIEEMSEHLKSNESMILNIREPIVVTRKNDGLLLKKLVSYHSDSVGNHVRFGLELESDGSKRIVDLLPAFLELSAENSNRIFVIDELDRSLHSVLTKFLLENYLLSCSKQSRGQLLFTTHDLLLMDQKIFRRDEMWVAERNQLGSSTLMSFNDYKDVRNDKDVRKSYLQGRLGGIPKVNFTGSYSNSNRPCENED